MRVLVVGAATTGQAVTRLLAARGHEVVLTDKRADAVRASELPSTVRLELGAHRLASFLEADEIVVSPGVPLLPELEAARARGIPIVGEIELASREVAAPILGITGTNGKSTTTALLGALCEQSGRPTFCGGNLGTPLAAAVDTPAAARGGLCIVELSSFQLETIDRFRPHVAVLLNITPDHLDRYPSMQEYVAAKARIFENQTPEDFAIVNGADAVALECAQAARAQPLRFTLRGTTERGAFLRDDTLVLRLGEGEECYPAKDLSLVGRHNLENAMAAFLAARLVGVTAAQVRQGARTFRALAHRMELIAEQGGLAFYDDSKGTNVGAVAASLDGFPRPYVLIAGGKHKGGEYAPLRPVLAQRCRALVLMGEAAPLLQEALGDLVTTRRVASMEEAVATAVRCAQPGDAVVLSPACSSFDMFKDYADRAAAFRAAVAQVMAKEGASS